jgi:two-component system, OmpR family, osmolarity sensor histidine kinase EnvZ
MTFADIARAVARVRDMVKAALPQSLLGRALMIIVTPAILLQLLLLVIFYENHWNLITRRLAGAVVAEVAAMNAMHDLIGDQMEGQAELIAFQRLALLMRYEPGGRLQRPLPERGTDLLSEKLANEIADRIDRPFVIDVDHSEREVSITIELADGLLHVIAPRERLFTSTGFIFVAWMLGASATLFTIAVIFMRNQIRPIRRLAKAVDRFGKGQDVGEFRAQGATEVRQAARAFGLMRARIKRQIIQRTEMLAGVSHDLKTPLTRMKLQIAMLGDGPDVTDLNSDIEEMEHMIEGYLAFARGEGEESAVSTDLDALLDEVVVSARRQGGDVRLEARTGLSMIIRPNAMKRCIGNLVSNAVRYATHVGVFARAGNAAVEIWVEDDGPGIPDDRREDVFRPFFRLDPSRNPRTGGVGLGLTIARDIARSHGGDLSLATAPTGGVRAIIRLPL